MSLLTRGREVASDPTEVPCAIRRAEAAGDFLLEFDHPQIALRSIIVEGHTGVRHEAQDFIAASLQAVDKAAWGKLR